MRCEVLAVGTELLLGQVVDTNSSWLGEQLALAGIDSHFQTKVGDNLGRIVSAIQLALDRSDAVIICGGLGPTQDDITREALAEVMNVPLVRHPEIEERIAAFFGARNRLMSPSNARQADVPVGATPIVQVQGTAPGLICPIGNKVAYAVPGVPHEMAEMFVRGILPDLRARMAERGEAAVIVSRVLRTWGTSESMLGELLQGRIEALDVMTGDGGTVTIAFLASGIEGIKIRLTARAATPEAAGVLLDGEESQVRAALVAAVGDIVFGVDDETMEQAVGAVLLEQGLTLGVAESLTGGLIASRVVDVPGASRWFRGGIVAYDSDVKFSLLGVPEGPVVTEEAARAMAEGVRRAVGSDVGLGITGVAGPDEQEGHPPGTVFVGLALKGEPAIGSALKMVGDRARIRQYATISALDLLRRELLGDRRPG